MTAARRALGGLLVGAAGVGFLAGIRLTAAFIVPRTGPLGWVIVAATGACGLMLVAPLLGEGMVLLNPRWARDEGRPTTTPVIAAAWPEHATALRHGDEQLDARDASIPALAERYGLGPGPLLGVAALAALVTAVSLVLLPMN